jgi:hypothetical protein
MRALCCCHALVWSVRVLPGLSSTSRFTNSAPIRWLGEISMSFYMVHMMIMFLLSGLFDDSLPEGGPMAICEEELFDQCMEAAFGGVEAPEPPIDWEGEPDAFCSACINAWIFGMLPSVPWYMIPVALSLSLLAGWGLTHCVEKPAQAWLRGESSFLGYATPTIVILPCPRLLVLQQLRLWAAIVAVADWRARACVLSCLQVLLRDVPQRLAECGRRRLRQQAGRVPADPDGCGRCGRGEGGVRCCRAAVPRAAAARCGLPAWPLGHACACQNAQARVLARNVLVAVCCWFCAFQTENPPASPGQARF